MMIYSFFLLGPLTSLVCWVAIRSLGALAGVWPWSDNRPRTLLFTTVLAILITGMFVGAANMMAGITEWPARDEQPRQ